MSELSKRESTAEQGRVARRRARTRADLLAAARQVFAQRGYHDASIAEITRLADVAVGTFYLHFHDKEEIFTAVVEEGYRVLGEHVLADLQQRPGEPRLALLIYAVLRYAYEERDLFLIALSGERGFAHTQERRAKSGLMDLILAELRKSEATEQSPAYDPALFASLITGMITQAISWLCTYDEPAPDVLAEHILHILRQGLPQAFQVRTSKMTDGTVD